MSPTTALTASLIEAGAAGYAAAAAGRLVENRPATAETFGDRAFGHWRRHLVSRLRELAAALVVSEPALFVSDVVWSSAGFDARELPLDHLRASLEELGEVLNEELPEESREEPLSYLRQALAALEAESKGGGAQTKIESEEERLALVYLEAALSGDRRRAIDQLLAAVDDGMPAETVYQKVLSVAQARVGEMWHRWELSVPQEHLVTSTTRSAMVLLARRFEARPANGKTVVVAVAPGNAHELATQALADFFEMDGWRTIHLGGEMSAEDLALSVEVFDADLLALSVALSTHVRSAIEVVRKVRAQTDKTRILLGGGVLSRTPGLWRKLGGDASAASFAEALGRAGELTA